jgi:hypothetical protein
VSAATDVYGLASSLELVVAGRAPARLADVLARALARDPADRPATAAQFAAALVDVERAEGWPPTPFLVGGVATGRRPAPRPGWVRRPRPRVVSGTGGGPSSGAR